MWWENNRKKHWEVRKTEEVRREHAAYSFREKDLGSSQMDELPYIQDELVLVRVLQTRPSRRYPRRKYFVDVVRIPHGGKLEICLDRSGVLHLSWYRLAEVGGPFSIDLGPKRHSRRSLYALSLERAREYIVEHPYAPTDPDEACAFLNYLFDYSE